MITCGEAVRRLWEYLDSELDTDEQQRVGEHLDLCRKCCGEAEFTAALRDKLRTTPSPELSEDVERHLVGFLEGLEREGP